MDDSESMGDWSLEMRNYIHESAIKNGIGLLYLSAFASIYLIERFVNLGYDCAHFDKHLKLLSEQYRQITEELKAKDGT
jgi:hypothetical protein